MDLDAEVAVLEKSRKTLTRWGIWGTALYLGCLLGYGGIAWRDFTALSPNEVGDFLAGVFAPLAFLWLVLGYRMQALELEQNSKALRQQAMEMRESVQAQSRQADTSVQHGIYFRQDVINKTREQFEIELGVMAVNFIGSGRIVEENGMHYGQPTWNKFSAGDREVFSKLAEESLNDFLSKGSDYFLPEGMSLNPYYDRGWADEYISHFDYFIKALTTLGDIASVDMYKQRSFGRLYDLLTTHRLMLSQVEG